MPITRGKTSSLTFAVLFLAATAATASPVPEDLLEDPGRKRRARSSFLEREAAPFVALRNIPAGGNPDVSGVESVSDTYLRTGGIGRAQVTISASWDYVGYSAAHRCALVNTSPHAFSGNVFVNGVYDSGASWTADATVVITRERNPGDTITADIRGGSVCELYAGVSDVDPFLPCSVNESVIPFTITGGTGRYADSGGSGSLRAVVDTCAVGGLPYDLTSATAPANAADAIVLDEISLRFER